MGKRSNGAEATLSWHLEQQWVLCWTLPAWMAPQVCKPLWDPPKLFHEWPLQKMLWFPSDPPSFFTYLPPSLAVGGVRTLLGCDGWWLRGPTLQPPKHTVYFCTHEKENSEIWDCPQEGYEEWWLICALRRELLVKWTATAALYLIT